MLIEVIATHLGIHRLCFSPTPGTVYRITNKYNLVPLGEVTARVFLRLMLGKEAVTPKRVRLPETLLTNLLGNPRRI